MSSTNLIVDGCICVLYMCNWLPIICATCDISIGILASGLHSSNEDGICKEVTKLYGRISGKDRGIRRCSGRMKQLLRESHTLFRSKGIGADKKNDTFLCSIGRDTFSHLQMFVAPAKQGAKMYKVLVDANGTSGLMIAEHFRFHKRM